MLLSFNPKAGQDGQSAPLLREVRRRGVRRRGVWAGWCTDMSAVRRGTINQTSTGMKQ